MDHDQNQDDRAVARGPRRARALTATAAALLCAATLAACGGSDEDDEPASTGASTTEQVQTASSTATTTPDADDASAADDAFADQDADSLLSAATLFAQQSQSVQVRGDMEDVMLDLAMVRGQGATGEIAQGVNRFEIVAVDGRFFLKGSEDFYRQLGGEGVVQLLGDRWLEAPRTDPEFASLAQLSEMDGLLSEILRPTGTLTKGEPTEVDGQPAIPLVSDATGGTLYVAATGRPYPLRIVAEDDRGEIVFSGWDEPVELTAPDDAVDISQLESSSGS